jgi:hypothetical protein
MILRPAPRRSNPLRPATTARRQPGQPRVKPRVKSTKWRSTSRWMSFWVANRLRRTRFMSFQWLQEIIGVPLPASARRRREWRANEAAGSHVQAHAWLNANWSVLRVDIDRGIVTFRRR